MVQKPNPLSHAEREKRRVRREKQALVEKAESKEFWDRVERVADKALEAVVKMSPTLIGGVAGSLAFDPFQIVIAERELIGPGEDPRGTFTAFWTVYEAYVPIASILPNVSATVPFPTLTGPVDATLSVPLGDWFRPRFRMYVKGYDNPDGSYKRDPATGLLIEDARNFGRIRSILLSVGFGAGAISVELVKAAVGAVKEAIPG